jgi:hypothetical protein
MIIKFSVWSCEIQMFILECRHESLPPETSSQSYFLFSKIHYTIILIPIIFSALYVVTCGFYKINYINLFNGICNHLFHLYFL